MKMRIAIGLWIIAQAIGWWFAGYLWGKHVGRRDGHRDARRIDKQWREHLDLYRRHLGDL